MFNLGSINTEENNNIPKKVTIRTSDRRSFRRCLRKWEFYSSLKKGMHKKGQETNIHFWFGSGIHFAMEDYMGYNKFGDPRRAFKAYCDVPGEKPDRADDYYFLGLSMLNHFLYWKDKTKFCRRFEPVWINGSPLLEVEFELKLPISGLYDAKNGVFRGYMDDTNCIHNYAIPSSDTDNNSFIEEVSWNPLDLINIPIYYHGTVDGIFKDKFDRWYIIDYKTAAKIDENKLDLDDQISAYVWALEQHLQHPIEGFIYLQMTKDFVKKPKILKTGMLSTDKKQRTVYYLYKKELERIYGDISLANSKEIETLNHLAEQEDEYGDKFTSYRIVTRNTQEKIRTYKNILGEAKAMLISSYFYPSPNKDCIWDCPLKSWCKIKDETGKLDKTFLDDYERMDFSAESTKDSWREFIKWPDSQEKFDVNEFEDDLEICSAYVDYKAFNSYGEDENAAKDNGNKGGYK